MADDYTSDINTTGTVAVGGSAAGELETAGDRDWFAVTLEADRTYRIDLEGSATDNGTLRDPFLRGIYDEHGTRISNTWNDDEGAGLNSQVTFTARAGGTYYVAAGAYSGTGTYTLSVIDVTADITDDYAAGTGTSGTVAVGGSATGEIETTNDRDWFAVTLEAGHTYRIDLEGTRTEGGTLRDPFLHGVHDQNGDLIPGTTNDDGNGTGLNSQVTFTARAGGTHYVAAGAYAGHGTYTLSVADITVYITDDYAAGTGTSGTVAVGASATGGIDTPGDVDWFAVTLEADKIYRIDLEGSRTSRGILPDPILRGIYDADGNLIDGTTNDDGGVGFNSQVTFTAEATGTYYVAAGSYHGVADRHGYETGTYTLSVTEVFDDFAAGTETSGTVAVGGSATGTLHATSDVDWFAVTLEAGSTYHIDLKGLLSRDGTLLDPYLHGVHDADGVLIAGTTNDNGGIGRNSRVTFTADEDGTYYVAAGTLERYTGTFYSRGTYTLSVSDITDAIAQDDFAAGIGTTGTVAVGGSATGEIGHVDDRDWFAVTLEANTTYRIDLEGTLTGGGTLSDPILRGIHDADGDFIPGTKDNSISESPIYGGNGDNSRVTFTPDETGTYYVAAGATLLAVGTYTLSVAELEDDFEAGTGTTGRVEVGASATGGLESAGDRDWFAVALVADTTYRIDLEGRETGAGTLWDPYLRGVHDANGVLIAGTTDDDGGPGNYNSRVTFTPDEDGTYYVAAGARWEDQQTGTYTLSVREVVDDFEAGIGTSGTVEVGGSATGEIDVPGDRDWFAVTLESGRSYRIDLEGSWTGAGTIWSPYLRGIHDADGDLISRTTDDASGTGWNSRLTFTPLVDGTYYVAAGARHDLTGTYTLSVTDVTIEHADDDYAAGTRTTGTVAVGGTATGEIENAGDHDWFAVTMVAGNTYRIDLEGSETGGGTLFDPYLYGTHDANGVFVGSTNDDHEFGSRNSRMTFRAEVDGTYYVSAGASGNHVGTYTLSVTDVTADYPDDYTANTQTTGTVAVGGSATGEIETADDHDWFAVTLEANTRYRIDLYGTPSGGTLEDTFLRGIHDADGVFIPGTTDDDGRGDGNLNSRVTFTPGENGTYYVAAGAFGEGTGTYTLSVEEVI